MCCHRLHDARVPNAVGQGAPLISVSIRSWNTTSAHTRVTENKCVGTAVCADVDGSCCSAVCESRDERQRQDGIFFI